MLQALLELASRGQFTWLRDKGLPFFWWCPTMWSYENLRAQTPAGQDGGEMHPVLAPARCDSRVAEVTAAVDDLGQQRGGLGQSGSRPIEQRAAVR